MRRRPAGALTGLASIALALSAGPALAQEITLRLDASAAHAQPPAGLTGLGPTTFGLLGARAELTGPGRLAADVSLYGGHDSEAPARRWWNGGVGLATSRWIGDYELGLRADAFQLGYHEPIDYTSRGLTLTPHLRTALGRSLLSVQGRLTRGGWRAGTDDPTAPRHDGRLALSGGDASLLRRTAGVWLEARGELYQARHDGEPARYAGLGLAASSDFGGWAAFAGVRYVHAPSGGEVGGWGTVSARLADGVEGYLTLGRNVTDPLYGTPGSFTASAGVSWTVARYDLDRPLPVVVVEASQEAGRRVRFQLPLDAGRHARITGDFTDWRPVPMQRRGDAWVVEFVLKPGLHYFGFLIDDGRWFVPDNTPGIVDDGWGRRNGSLLVEAP